MPYGSGGYGSGGYGEGSETVTVNGVTVTLPASAVAGALIARDFLLDDDGDIALDEADLGLARGSVALAQSILLRLGFFLGEWFLDEEVGVPYHQQVFVKNPNVIALREVFRQALLDTPGVATVTSLDLTVDPSTRDATLSFTATGDLGEFISANLLEVA